MWLTKRRAVWGLVLAGLGALAYLSGALTPLPGRQEIKGLDLSLRDVAFEPAELGGGYGRYAFLAQGREAAVTAGDRAPLRGGTWRALETQSLLLPYAGVGLGPFKLSMDLSDLDVWLAKDKSTPKETKDYVRERLRSAVWLIKSIHQRQRTIVKVMESIVRFQRAFFDRGPEFLRPLNLRDVADDIGMHESTVSRVTTNKYAQTPHGVFELKFFFNSSIRTGDGDGIASESVKEKIAQIIKAEDPRKPYSDQKIAELLREADIHIARRTVTKYREALRILSSTRRKQIG